MNNACPAEWAKEVVLSAKVMNKHNVSMSDATTSLINPHCMLMQFSKKYSEGVICAFANDLFHELGALDGNKRIGFGEGTDYCMLDKDDNPRRYYVMMNNRKVICAKPNSEEYKYSVAAINMDAESADNVSDDVSDSDIGEWEEGDRRISQMCGDEDVDCLNEDYGIEQPEESRRKEIEKRVSIIMGKYGIASMIGVINPYCYNIQVEEGIVKESVIIAAFNEVFHAFGVLPEGEILDVGDVADYCEIYVENGAYFAPFNDPTVVGLSEDDDNYQYILKEIRPED